MTGTSGSSLKGPEIIGNSPSLQKVFETIEKVAATDANVLLLGENGTGKELVARALHLRSGRSHEAFVAVDMGSISESLFESELFGHVKGAFTDAKKDRSGRFEAAHRGTLFLDEIGNLSLGLQAKLLNVLQQRSVTRVGSNQAIEVDIRLISATNLPINEKVADLQFRQDLLYRLNTVEIHLPPLRQRLEDLPLLIDHFVAKYARKYQKQVRGVTSGVLQEMQRYLWPGNIRELEHAIERAVILGEGELLSPSDFSLQHGQNAADSWKIETLNLQEVEKILIQKAIAMHGGNITRAAQELGLTRPSLYRRIAKYDLPG